MRALCGLYYLLVLGLRVLLRVTGSYAGAWATNLSISSVIFDAYFDVNVSTVYRFYAYARFAVSPYMDICCSGPLRLPSHPLLRANFKTTRLSLAIFPAQRRPFLRKLYIQNVFARTSSITYSNRERFGQNFSQWRQVNGGSTSL